VRKIATAAYGGLAMTPSRGGGVKSATRTADRSGETEVTRAINCGAKFLKLRQAGCGAKQTGCGLFVAEGFDGVHIRSTAGRI
jgi:hypothetical protein